jgi:hypothetical protein
MKRFVVASLLGFCTALLAQPASYLAIEAAINKAGRQRMLSEFLVKEYVQVAENVLPGNARGSLFETITIFDDQLSDLKAFASDAETRATVDELEKQWLRFRSIATRPPERSNALLLRAAGLALHEAAEHNAAALERRAGTARGKLVGLAGRQRMLSQRIAKNYLLLGWKLTDPSIREELIAADAQFDKAQRELTAAASSDALRAELAEVEKLWRGLRPLLTREVDIRFNRVKVVDATDAILSRMERVTTLFEKEPR